MGRFLAVCGNRCRRACFRGGLFETTNPSLVRGARIGFRSNSNSSSNNDGDSESPGIRSESPFDVLGIPKTATYADAKRKFLELALRHHPDHAAEGASPEAFVRYRKAFELLAKDGKGSAAGDDSWTDEEFRAWYYDEMARTASDQSASTAVRLDATTRREVIDVVRRSSRGGLDRGGIWEWARRLAEEDANLMETKHKYKRTVGLEDNKTSSSNNNTTKSLQRRRRKKR